jgi:inhibitor of cysteine peptidase
MIMFLGVAVVACGDDGGSSSDVTEYTDDSQPIDVSVGDEFKIRLESNPGTGYSWELQKPLDESIVKAVGNSEFEQGSTDAPGAPGDEVLTYEAVGAGTTKIRLGYERSFENKPPTDTKTFTVEVSG